MRLAASVPALDAGAEQIAEHALARGASGSPAPVANSGRSKKTGNLRNFAQAICHAPNGTKFTLSGLADRQTPPRRRANAAPTRTTGRRCTRPTLRPGPDRCAAWANPATSNFRQVSDGWFHFPTQPPASHGNGVRLAADQVHLDRGPTLVPSGLVGERRDRKIAFEFTIDAAEKVEIELRGDASSVIIRGDQSPDVFAQVDSDNRLATLTDMLAHTAKQGGGFGAPEIAECGARKKGGAGMSGTSPGMSNPP